jgi:acetyl-CoA carboxylase/biotin carboxylase 1
MRALGDKISSTIVAQSLKVPVVPWSGSGIEMNPEDCFDEAKCAPIYRRACVTSLAEVQAAASQIGFPLMIKASEGGGGKGIRKVLKEADLKLSFEQVASEVPGSPIFLMALSQHSRHLEIQVVADRHGNCVTLFGRDCSVQRRHQKIIEEAPISCVSQEMTLAMEADAIALAKSVRYESVGTIEFLYDIDKRQYYFLELNPRLQVEHPTTEMVSGVNIPATQLQIAIGLPLFAIGDIRRLWQQQVSGGDCSFTEAFSLAPTARHAPKGHVVAARITAENPDAGFKPNSGKLWELSFRGFPETWGYFSVAPGGGLHEFSDSQFGHIFAHAPSREEARQSMVMALKELSIRGEFRTTVEYLIELLEREVYCENSFDTAWLDGLIAAQAEAGHLPQRVDPRVAVVAGGAAVALLSFAANEEAVLTAIKARGIPTPTLLASDLPVQFIHDGISYRCTVRRSSAAKLDLSFANSGESVTINAALMPDGGFLMGVGGMNFAVYARKEGDNYRITVNGKTCILESEADPSTIKSPSPGKLIRLLIEDGAHVQQGLPVAEIEVMKMIIPLLSGESGVIKLVKPAGSAIETGDIIGNMR